MKQVKCIKSCHFNGNDFVFEAGSVYPIIEEYSGAILISQTGAGYLVFSNGDFEDWFHRDYREFFVKI